MSFETWRQSVYPFGIGSAEKYARNAWEYCRAESEAQIAALQLERDALLAEAQERGVRLSTEFLDRKADANFMPNEPAKLLLHEMASALRLNLLTTASGEPARKA